MAERRVFIHAAGAIGPQACSADARQTLRADAAPANLKALVKAALGQPLRQASHFIELAALGAHACMRQLPAIPAATALYLGTGLADVTKAEAVFRQVVSGNLASPFDFINAANNMAAFYVARLAQLDARNLTLMQNEFSFEYALRLALDDLRYGEVASALVGGVDEVTQSRAAHLQRLPLDDDQLLGEGSGWLYLNTNETGAGAELLAVTSFADNLGALVEVARAADEPVRLLPGFRLKPAEIAQLSSVTTGIEIEGYVEYCGCYYTAAAYGLARALARSRERPTLLAHVNRDDTGTVMLILARTCA